jgi:hypothetical protein
MKREAVLILSVLGFLAPGAVAAPRELPLRWEPATCIHGASTSQTIENDYGTNLLAIPFAATTTYDFYSPPLSAATALTTKDKGGGKVFMSNVSPTHANDFSVSGRMAFYDYDPSSGTQNLIVDTGDSGAKNVNRGQSVNWALPNASLISAATIPVGHLLHVAVTLKLISGLPAGFGELMYNGDKTTTTVAFLSEDNAASWTLSPPVLPVQKANSLCITSDGCAHVSCSGYPNQVYCVQATTSLRNPVWSTVSTNTAGSDGSLVFVDTDAPKFPARFYRTVSQ